jgi:hypothetical protein
VFQKFQRARALIGPDWLLFIEVWIAVFALRTAFRLVPFKTLLTALPRSATLAGPCTLDPVRLAYLIELASRHHVFKPTCLETALVLNGILRRNGITADLKIGTHQKNGQFQAHAWVEYNGRVILGGSTESYVPLCSLEEVQSRRQFA